MENFKKDEALLEQLLKEAEKMLSEALKKGE